MNPWQDGERYTKIEDFFDPEEVRTPRGRDIIQKLPQKAYKVPTMPHSQSENNIAFRSGVSSSSNSSQFSHISLPREDDHIRFSEDTAISSTFSRGRSSRRTPSPTKDLEDIQEDQSLMTPSPSKRSRSPMKRMFGEGGWLGKSMSMNELPSEQYRKTGLKHWSGKIKKGMESLVCSNPGPPEFLD